MMLALGSAHACATAAARLTDADDTRSPMTLAASAVPHTNAALCVQGYAKLKAA